MTYLGVTLHADGGVKRELNRKLGAVWADFSKLARLWNHAPLPKDRRLRIYKAVVVSRLLYGLSTAWLNAAELRRLQGFHCRCLRRILGIAPAYFSRVSNLKVLQEAGEVPLGRQLLQSQLILYGRVVRAPDTDPIRKLTFIGGTTEPATNKYIRRVGRPRNTWAAMLQKETFKMGTEHHRQSTCEAEWKRAVHQHCIA